jgi:hypothetical protein
MVYPKTVWIRLRTQLTSQLHLTQKTLLAPPPTWRTPVVSLRGHAEWQEARRTARPLLVIGATYVVAWPYLLVAAFLSAQLPPGALFPPEGVLLAAPEPQSSAALAQRSRGVQHPGLSSRHLE